MPFADRDSIFPQALVRVWVKVPHLVAGSGLHCVTLPQHLVPLALRLSLLQFFKVRVWEKLLPAHTVPAGGCHAVTPQYSGQDLVPVAVRLSLLQSLRVRVCGNCFPPQTVPVAGLHEVILHLGGQCFVPVTLRLPVEQLPRVRA